MTDVVLFDVEDRIATITLNRPEARNALSIALRQAFRGRLEEANDRDDVDVVVVTGTDPAFCAGMDLKEMGQGLRPPPPDERGSDLGPWRFMTKPVIGAINGVALTGGLEIALNCDFLVASERARFGDTHGRVGVMPGAGLSVNLVHSVGVRRAREMSYTGNFVDAQEALRIGLVNHVVPHEELLPFTHRLARDIIGNDQVAVRTLKTLYWDVASATFGEAWEVEQENRRRWHRTHFDPAEVERRRAAVVERGRAQS